MFGIFFYLGPLMFILMRVLIIFPFDFKKSAENQRSIGPLRLLFCFLLAVLWQVVPAFAQKKKSEKISSQRSLSQKPLDKISKAKTYDAYNDFVIVDYRAGSVPGVVEPDEENAASLKKDLEAQFPLLTVFETSDANVCVLGVESPADAKTVFSKTNPKKSRIAKRDNIGKMLAEINVKLITKEK